jgi:RNA polymerase sigma factor (sigma-70 family)
MTDDDMGLVREYAAGRSEDAFAILVERHIGLVHSAALRRVNNPQLAEEITQAVFILLARKAASLKTGTILPGWLYRTTGYVAADALKIQRRRESREQEAYMQSIINEAGLPVWREIAPLLESAMDRLNDHDRNALLLRYFEDKTLAEVGAALGVTEDAARVRVNRALEKLHRYFSQHGISSTTAILVGAVSANCVQAAPVGLAQTISAVAAAKGVAAGTSTLTLVKGALKIMAWTKIKTTVVVGAALLLCAGTPLAVHVIHQARSQNEIFTLKTDVTDAQNTEFQDTTGATPAVVAKAFLDACANSDWTELDQYGPKNPRNQNDYSSYFSETFKQAYGGLQIISLGKPFKARLSIAALIQAQPSLKNQFKSTQGDFESRSVFVPYQVRLKDGTIRTWQLSIRCDNPEHHWYFDGGF